MITGCSWFLSYERFNLFLPCKKLNEEILLGFISFSEQQSEDSYIKLIWNIAFI